VGFVAVRRAITRRFAYFARHGNVRAEIGSTGIGCVMSYLFSGHTGLPLTKNCSLQAVTFSLRALVIRSYARWSEDLRLVTIGPEQARHSSTTNRRLQVRYEDRAAIEK
jgi:hypothetical protein